MSNINFSEHQFLKLVIFALFDFFSKVLLSKIHCSKFPWIEIVITFSPVGEGSLLFDIAICKLYKTKLFYFRNFVAGLQTVEVEVSFENSIVGIVNLRF